MTTARSTFDASSRAPAASGRSFADRHIGPDDRDIGAMLEAIGFDSLDALIDATVPPDIRLEGPLDLPAACGEAEALDRLRRIASLNTGERSMIGMGYHGTFTPPVILRSILQNPLWYTAYTPYQAEIAQGRLEALLNFQTMVADLTALPLANASLLDEATAAAEAMSMCRAIDRRSRPAFCIADDCHPQTISVVRTRAASMGIDLRAFSPGDLPESDLAEACGVLVQVPTTDGRIEDYAPLAEAAHRADALVVAACDILALTLIRPPGEWGADIAVGSTRRFGVPMGYGGPHAAYLATGEKHARKMPGRIVGLSRDAAGRPAHRLAIQTREQHIKRDRATSNICTAQVLLAVMAGMYAVWHGPDGLRRIARRVHATARHLADGLQRAGFRLRSDRFFDTIAVEVKDADAVVDATADLNIRKLDQRTVGIATDETTTAHDCRSLLASFGAAVERLHETAVEEDPAPGFEERAADMEDRTTGFLTHPVFNSYHGEHEFLRYVTRLQSLDVTLADSMIPLGSCTMKLNAAVEMTPITWPAFADPHPYAPADQVRGYARVIADLEKWLCEITGFAAVSLQPNAGSQGEYAGLLAIRRYHESRGHAQRNVCLIPTSAHGTNPASAVIAGLDVVAVACDERGDIDVGDLRARARQHGDALAALMVTYPSTHGVFEGSIRQICDVVHEAGGLIYMDGANMNAQVGLCSPARIGADVCHLNLHKTFCIPHGGGGPGMGPIAVAGHLAPFLPSDPVSGEGAPAGPVSAAPYGSPSILPICWVYIALMGADGLKKATRVAILNANYIAHRLRGHYELVYRGDNGTVAHEGIIDCRPFEKSAGVRVEDIAKRLIDFGFHAPTISWPVAGTMMIEPTESESKAELDRFADAMIAIREEIARIESGDLDREDNPLRNAPHTAEAVTAADWPHPYSRREAAWPAPWLAEPGRKYWPPVGRIDNAHGDRHLVCTCPTVEQAAGP